MSRFREPAKPRKVDGFWYLVRRVPAEFAKLDKRTLVMLSTGVRIVDDPRCVRGGRVVQQLDQELQAYWLGLKAGRDPAVLARWEWARETARRFGFEYLEGAVLQGQLSELLQRVEALRPLSEEERRKVRPALLGEVEAPKGGTTVSEMLPTYEGIIAASLLKKSAGQLKRWRTTRQTALGVFEKIVGKEKRVADLTHDDAFALRDFWNKRVLAGEVQIDSANKQIGYVAAMFREINEFQRLKMDDIFHRKSIRGGEKKQRVAFDIAHVQDVLLAPGAMDKLNDEARAIFYVVAELGLRPSEVCGLTENAIHLDAEIPYIEVKSDGRQLKTGNSEREVPLVGVALEVMKAFPTGFAIYRDRSDVLSAAVQKHLSRNKLLQRDGQSFYSLRHTFKDRLRDARVEGELVYMLMGHATGKESYGRGYLLKMKYEALSSIVFKAPPVSFGQRVGRRGPGRRPSHEGQSHLLGHEKARQGLSHRKAILRPSARLAEDVRE